MQVLLSDILNDHLETKALRYYYLRQLDDAFDDVPDGEWDRSKIPATVEDVLVSNRPCELIREHFSSRDIYIINRALFLGLVYIYFNHCNVAA